MHGLLLRDLRVLLFKSLVPISVDQCPSACLIHLIVVVLDESAVSFFIVHIIRIEEMH